MQRSIKKQTVILIMGLIVLISTLFLVVQYTFQQKVIANLVHEERSELTQLYNFSLKNLYDKYLLIGNNLLTNSMVCDAIVSQNRKQLFKLTEPFFRQLQEDNPYVNIMHFHTAKTTSLLRLHRPDKYGDDLSNIRHLINAVNEGQTPLFALEVGKYAISHRIALPIIVEGKAYGVLEFGIDIRYFNELFQQNLHTKNLYALDKNAITPYLEYQHPSQEYTLQELFLIGSDELSWVTQEVLDRAERDEFANIAGTNTYLYKGDEQFDFQGQHLGSLYLLLDIDYFAKHAEVYRYLIAGMTLFLLLLSYIVLHYAFAYYHRELEGQQQLLIEKNAQLEEMATIDPLTKIYNRRKTSMILEREYERHLRYGGELSIIMFDIDDFKKINDTYGHNVGDEVLQQVADLVMLSIRKTDYFGRWGGEEFLIVSIENNLQQATELAEKLRKTIDEYAFDFNHIGKITCSFGVGQYIEGQSIKEMIHEADSAMYIAKHSGKNCVKTNTKPAA